MIAPLRLRLLQCPCSPADASPWHTNHPQPPDMGSGAQAPPDDGPGDGGRGDDDAHDDMPPAEPPNAAFFHAGFWYIFQNGTFSACSPEQVEEGIQQNRCTSKRWARRLGRLLASLRGGQDLAEFAAICGRTVEAIARLETGRGLLALQFCDGLQSVYGGPFVFLPPAEPAVVDRARARAMGAEFREARQRAGLGLEAAAVLAELSIDDLLAIESGWMLREFPAVQDVLAACRSRIQAEPRATSEATRLRDFVLGACSD